MIERIFTPIGRSSGALLALLAAPLSLSCGDKAEYDDTGVAGDLPYCYVVADGDTHYIDAGGGVGGSGKLYGRLLTDKSADVHDPNFVASVEYTLQNNDTGGIQQVGKTNVGGDFVETLGAGSWEIKVATQKQGYSCENQYTFSIEAGNTTYLCLDLGCK